MALDPQVAAILQQSAANPDAPTIADLPPEGGRAMYRAMSEMFDLQDVPFVQYFHRGFALHGAYWHDEFGKERSHGCINLSPADARYLFQFTQPVLPPGWNAILTMPEDRPTVVRVR